VFDQPYSIVNLVCPFIKGEGVFTTIAFLGYTSIIISDRNKVISGARLLKVALAVKVRPLSIEYK
jgi:hypothetical protein